MSLIHRDFCSDSLNANILEDCIYLTTKPIWFVKHEWKLMRVWAHWLKFHSSQQNGSWSSSQRISEGPFHLKTMMEPVEVCGCIELIWKWWTWQFYSNSWRCLTIHGTFFFRSCCTDLRKAFFSFCMEAVCCCGCWLLSRTCCSGSIGCSVSVFLPFFEFKNIKLQDAVVIEARQL